MKNKKEQKISSFKVISHLAKKGYTDDQIVDIGMRYGFSKFKLKFQLFFWRRPYLTMFLYILGLLLLVLALDYAFEWGIKDILLFFGN